MRYRMIETPTGLFALLQSPDGRIGSTWIVDEDDPAVVDCECDESILSDLTQRVREYFAGRIVDFSDVPLPEGSEFFSRCWAACRTIPRGETRGYGELAEMSGAKAAAARAAGQAMRRNPLPIIVPCHRVLATGGRLGGFCGSDDPQSRQLNVKRWLLGLEGASPRVDRESTGAVIEEQELLFNTI